MKLILNILNYTGKYMRGNWMFLSLFYWFA